MKYDSTRRGTSVRSVGSSKNGIEDVAQFACKVTSVRYSYAWINRIGSFEIRNPTSSVVNRFVRCIYMYWMD